MSDIILNVPQYYPQTDSATRHGDRMCFSSSMAMGIKFLWPDSLKGANADDDYLRTVLKYGDTTIAASQVRAAADYNVKATLHKNGTLDKLQSILRSDRPVPVGFLHHGPSSAPRGGGHWALLTGLSSTHAIMHDPYGELDNVRGGYIRIGPFGKNIRYTLKNWLPRWTHGGEAWFMDISCIEKPSTPTISYPNTWEGISAAAKDYGAKFPDVVAAQWALESGWGKHTSGKHNYFGIKGKEGEGTLVRTTEFVAGMERKVDAWFKNYSSLGECVSDLIDKWYKDYKGYKGINRANTPEEACNLLVKEGYATDPAYTTKLIALLRNND